MIPSIGQDVTDHLHERGGPLDFQTWADPPVCPLCKTEHEKEEQCPEGDDDAGS